MGSDSDFEPDVSSGSDSEDPDCIEVPGGGKSLTDVQDTKPEVKTEVTSASSSSTSSSTLPLPKLEPLDKKPLPPRGHSRGGLPLVDIKPFGGFPGGQGQVKGTSAAPFSNLFARLAGLTDDQLAKLQKAPEPLAVTPIQYFVTFLPRPFLMALMQQIVSGDVSSNDLSLAMNFCNSDPALLQLLLHMTLYQDDPDSVIPLPEPVKSKYKFPGISALPAMTPGEILRYFVSVTSGMGLIGNSGNPYFKELRQALINAGRDHLFDAERSVERQMIANQVRIAEARSSQLGPFGMPNIPGLNPMMPGLNPIAQAPQQQRYRPSVETLWGSSSVLKMEMEAEQQAEEEEEQEEMTVAETYADYKPAKLEYGKKHPDPIVETASLASVLPPACYYKLSLPDKVISSGLLSALQLESVVYASQQHEHFLPSNERAGFLIGDGAGVGKGRTIAGIIFENFLSGRKKSIWVSVSNDLVYDSERDLKDIGASQIKIHQLSKIKYGKIEGISNGVLFLTYSGLIGEAAKGKNNTRLKQIIQWCGPKFDGVVVFDECHRAKNLCPNQGKSTKTGIAVRELQETLPKARVVYASATGASEPRHMAYMTRLGLWGKSTPFPTVQEFVKSVEQRGVGAMELIAMDMKLRGAYIARQLSFQGVKFTAVDVPLPKAFEAMYDDSVEFWINAMNKFIEAMVFMKCNKKAKRSIWTNFWGAHQRFFKYLCIASKVKHTVEVARNAVKDGKCVVIGLQATGEARTMEQLERDEGELTEFVSTAKGVLQHLVEKSFPVPGNNKVEEKNGKATGGSGVSSMFQNLMDEMKEEQAGPSTRNRKPVRKAAQKQNFRKLNKMSSDESGSEEHSEFEVSEEESEESEALSEYSEAESSEEEEDSDSDDGDSGDRDEGSYGGRKRSKKQRKGPAAKKAAKGSQVKGQKEETGVVSKEAKAAAIKIRDDLLKQIETLGEKLPPNTLDQLIDELGGSTEVAEMTGRKGRVIQDDQGSVSYETRSEIDVSLETINLKEKERFMKGEKLIAIISEAASSGISLQSDKRVANQRTRVHITLELPWSADRAIQQFGRTHRSNQMHPPEYLFLISNMAGEHRFASIVAKRLESLGALTHGDRRATESRDLSKYNIDNKFGRLALGTVMRSIMQQEPAVVPPPPQYANPRAFYADVANALVGVGLVINSPNYPGQTVLDKDALNMTKFLNRILGMRIQTQNALFQYFTDTLAEVVKRAKRSGRFDVGILDLTDGELRDVTLIEANSYRRRHATGTGLIELHRIKVNRGMSWEDAESRFSAIERTKQEGFYLASRDIDGRRQCLLALQEPSSDAAKKKLFMVYRPHIGLQPKRENITAITGKYEKVDLMGAKVAWEAQYTASGTTCTHMYWGRSCKNRLLGNDCEIGVRQRVVHILSGSVLLVWADVESILVNSSNSAEVKMQVIRVRGADFKIIGLVIPNNCVTKLRHALEDENYASNKKEKELTAAVAKRAGKAGGGKAD